MTDNNGMSPRTTAIADQDRAAADESLLSHVVGIAALIRSEDYDPVEAWVRLAMMFEGEDYDRTTVARIAATAIVRLAETMRADELP